MASTAGYLSNVYASAAGSVWTAVAACKSFNDGNTFAELKTTAFGGSGYETRILGLNDRPVTLECDYDEADAGQDILRASARTGCFIKILHDGTNGFSQPIHVTSKPIKGDPGSIVTQSFSLVSNGAPTAYP